MRSVAVREAAAAAAYAAAVPLALLAQFVIIAGSIWRSRGRAPLHACVAS